MAKKGVNLVCDIFKKNGEFFSQMELKTYRNITTNYLEYYSLVASVKEYMKTHNIEMLQTNIPKPALPFYLSIIIENKKGAKDLYNILNRNNDTPTCRDKWQQTYNIDDTTWREIFLSPFTSTKSTSLQWFQMRINHNILPTQKYLFNIKVAENPLCQLCKVEENIPHMLWHCPETSTFLQKIKEKLAQRQIDCNFTEKEFIFNYGNTHADLEFRLNLKQYIFISKFHKKNTFTYCSY